MKFDLSKIDEYFGNFPYSSFREGQRECIEFILKSFESGKRVVIAECPTGSGKSAIGMTVAQFFDSSFYITITKQLQSQMMGDFGAHDVVDLKGRSNYECTFYKNFGKMAVTGKGMTQHDLDKLLRDPPNCNTGYCRKKDKKFKCPLCFPDDLPSPLRYSLCPYYERVFQAVNAKMALMNFSSFLYQTGMTTRFGPRELLIADEAHNAEPQLLNFVSLTINDKLLRKFGFVLEEFDLPEEYALFFIDFKILEIIGQVVKMASESEDIDTQDEYTQLYRKIKVFMSSMEYQEEWVAEFKKFEGYNTVQLKPVYVRSKATKLLLDYGEKTLLMSATVLDVDIFCSSLGIPRKDVAAYRMRNRFPVENRPIYLRSAGRIVGGKDKMHLWSGKLVEQCDKVIDKYPDCKGIIHTHNFAIADLLMAKSRHKKRFLYQKQYPTKERMLEVHAASTNTLIVAPAMHEGLDLVGELSRLQIICKVPWPNFYEDKQLARRVELDRRYLTWLTALKTCQSYGRSVRSETDWAHTYVLDEVFVSFLDDAKTMLPNWFKEAVDLTPGD